MKGGYDRELARCAFWCTVFSRNRAVMAALTRNVCTDLGISYLGVRRGPPEALWYQEWFLSLGTLSYMAYWNQAEHLHSKRLEYEANQHPPGVLDGVSAWTDHDNRPRDFEIFKEDV